MSSVTIRYTGLTDIFEKGDLLTVQINSDDMDNLLGYKRMICKYVDLSKDTIFYIIGNENINKKYNLEKRPLPEGGWLLGLYDPNMNGKDKETLNEVKRNWAGAYFSDFIEYLQKRERDGNE